MEYSTRWKMKRIRALFLALPQNTPWNIMVCVVVCSALVYVFLNPKDAIEDVLYDLVYAVHVLALLYSNFMDTDSTMDIYTSVTFTIDLATFSHYLAQQQHFYFIYKLVCYYIRLHRPFRYLWQLNDYSLKGGLLGTTLKYCYIFVVLRITWAMLWMYLDRFKRQYFIETVEGPSAAWEYAMVFSDNDSLLERFYKSIYIINKMFIPIGPSVAPKNDLERITCLLVMISGSLVVTGTAVATLSLVISIYMRPEESFRSRYRLIMKEMRESYISSSLRDKVKTFYRMYWHKQRAVSETHLLPIFPPTLPAMVYTDIYFKATQKSRILRDLSYPFLMEIAKKMVTIHYIPGDALIKRSTNKSSIIYIAYGDVEMLTPEDDNTAMLRMICGTILSPYAPCPVAGSSRAHVEIRAATFCTAHVLHAADLWKTALKYGRNSGQNAIILNTFQEHLSRVIGHYFQRTDDHSAKYKSSILHFKRNLMDLKDSTDSAGNLLMSQSAMKLEIAGNYVMRNRADASLLDESDAICLRPTFPCILQPKSSLQVAWNTLVTCVTLAFCFFFPYILVFNTEDIVALHLFCYSVANIIYMFDIVVYLSTGSHVEDGIPITLAQTASKQARSKWFVLDVISVWPIFAYIGDGSLSGLNMLLRLPKVFRMLKAVEEQWVYHSKFLRFLSYSLLLIIACYLMAALQQGFMCYHFNYCTIYNYTHPPYWDNNNSKEDAFDKISFCLYWAVSVITFTTHMETWVMSNLYNVVFTMTVLEICIVLHIFIEAFYSATIIVTTAMEEDFDAHIEDVTNFLIRNDVDPVLRYRFITYFQLDWYTDKAYSITSQNKSIFYDLPSHVYQDIVARQRTKYMLCIPFMKFLHQGDLKNVASNARLFYTSPNEILLNTGDISNEMYVIKRGSCEVLNPKTQEVTAKLDSRNHFGVLECLLRFPAYYTIRAATHVQVFSISRRHLLNAIQIPKIKDALEFVKQQPEYHRIQRCEQFVVYHLPDPPPNMQKFRLPRKHEQDHAFLDPFHKLGVLSVLRYIFPRFTFRPDGYYFIHCEWFRALCAMLSAIVFPGYTYLVLQWQWLYYVTFLLDFAAYFDIMQRMLVAYYDAKGILVYHPISTAARYLRGPFVVDLLGCLPLERMESAWQETFDNRYRIAPTKQFLMLNRLLQLYRTPGALLGLTGLIRRDILLVIRATPLFLALLNVLTCFVIFYSVSIFYKIEDDSWFIIPHNDNGGSWIEIFQHTVRFNMTETPYNLHLAAFFWVVYETTTTGYGSIKPTNVEVMRILTLGMLTGTIITTYFSVRILSMRAHVSKSLASYQQHMRDIVTLMKEEQLDEKLQKEVFEYYEYNWDRMGGVDYRSVLKSCNQITLRTDAILSIFGSTFTKCAILNQCDVSLLRIIGRAFSSLHFLKDTTIIQKDDIISDIYFIDEGLVEVRDDNQLLVSLTKGSMFGNLDVDDTIRCPVSFTPSTQVHVLRIDSSIFYSIINDFPLVSKLLKAQRPKNENYISATSDVVQMKAQKRRSPKTPSKRFQNLHMRNKLIQFYLIFVSLSCMYVDVYNMGFQDNRTLLIIILYALDVSFYWKFLIEYLLAQQRVRTHLISYKKSYFLFDIYIDIVSCAPIELFSLLSSHNRWMKFSWLRLNRLLRIVTVYKALRRHRESISINLSLTIICTVVIWFTLFIHVFACLWYFIGTMEERANPRSSWLYNDSGKPWCNHQYVCSLYFVLTTFTQNGVGDILPKQHSEVVFVSILQIVSTMMYIIYLGEFSNLIQYQSFRSFKYYSYYLELQEFLKNNRVSRNLVTVVNKYCLHLWQETRGVQVPHFLTTAPDNLKLKIMSATYLYHLSENEVFRECEPAFLRQLVGYLKRYTYNEGMYVVKEMEITDSMYFIHKGHVEESSENSNESRIYRTGECFGLIQGLNYEILYKYSYRTLTKSQVLTLYLKDWENLLKHFPYSKKVIYKPQGDTFKPDDDSYKEAKLDQDDKKYPQKPSTNDSDLHNATKTIQTKEERDTIQNNKLEGSHLTNLSQTPNIIKSTKPSLIEQQYIWPTNFKTSSDEEELTNSSVNNKTKGKLQTRDVQSVDVGETDNNFYGNIPSTSYSNAKIVSELIHDVEKTAISKIDSKLNLKLKTIDSLDNVNSIDDKLQREQNNVMILKDLELKQDSITIPISSSQVMPQTTHINYEQDQNEPQHKESYELKTIRDSNQEIRNINSLDNELEGSHLTALSRIPNIINIKSSLEQQYIWPTNFKTLSEEAELRNISGTKKTTSELQTKDGGQGGVDVDSDDDFKDNIPSTSYSLNKNKVPDSIHDLEDISVSKIDSTLNLTLKIKDSLHKLNSVENDLQRKPDNIIALKDQKEESVKIPLSNSRVMKPTTHVHYDQDQNKPEHVESHELKAIRNLSEEMRNLNSLDNEMIHNDVQNIDKSTKESSDSVKRSEK